MKVLVYSIAVLVYASSQKQCVARLNYDCVNQKRSCCVNSATEIFPQTVLRRFRANAECKLQEFTLNNEASKCTSKLRRDKNIASKITFACPSYISSTITVFHAWFPRIFGVTAA